MPDIRKVNTATGGQMYVDFDLLNPEARQRAMQYTPEVMSVAPAEPQPAPQMQDGLSPEWRTALATGATDVMPPPGTHVSAPLTQPSHAEVMFNTPTAAIKSPTPEPAAMMAPQAAQEQPTAQTPQVQEHVQEPVQAVPDQMPQMGMVMTRGHGGGASPSRKTILNAMEQEKAAIQSGYDAQAAGSASAANVYDEALKKIEQRDAEIETKRAASEAAFNDSIKKHDQAIEEVRSMKIDPDHYLNSKSTGQKIMMGLAIGFRNGDDKFLQNAINRDMDAQSAGIKTRMEYVNNLKISADMKQDMLHDLDRQRSIKSAQVLEAAKLKIESITSRTTSEAAKSEGDKVIAQLTQKQETIKQQMAAQDAARAASQLKHWIMTPGGPMFVDQKTYLNHMYKMGGGDMTASEKLQRERFEYDKAKDARAMSVPGYKGLATSEGAARKFAEEVPTYDQVRGDLKELKDVSSQVGFGTKLYDAMGGRNQLINKVNGLRESVKLLYKGLSPIALGQISTNDDSLLKKVIADPMDFINRGGDLDRLQRAITNMQDLRAKYVGLQRENAPTSGVKAGL